MSIVKVHVFSLESDIVSHCNNSCIGCNHHAPIRKPEYMAPERLARDLAQLAQIAEADKFIVLGGEPTLHPDLAQVLRVVRASGIAPLVELWTNGQREMPYDVWLNLDSVVVNFYPGKTTPEQQDALRAKAEQMGVALDVWKLDRFYKNRLRTPRENAREYFAQCPYPDHCHSIRNGYLYRCPQSSVIPGLYLGLAETTDGIVIEGLSAEGLQAFLKNTEPRRSCSICSRYDVYVDWREVVRDSWAEESSICQ